MTRSNRIEYVDGLRGLAVIAMFFVHTAAAYLSPEVYDQVYWKWAMRISGMVAPTFMFLAGISIALVASKTRDGQADELALRMTIVRRGFQIWLIGYGMHFTFWALGGFFGPFWKVFKVDILHCIGASLVVFPWIAWPRSRFNGSALVLFIMIPVIAGVTYRLLPEGTIPGGIAAYFTPHGRLALFPFIPYASWFALGLFVGPLWVSFSDNRKGEYKFWIGLFFAAVACWIIGWAIKQVYFGWGLHIIGTEIPQTRGLIYLFWKKAAFVLGLFILARMLAPVFKKAALGPLLLFGRHSLFAYCAHLIIIYPVAARFFSKSLLPWQQIISAIGLGIMTYGLTVGWRWLQGRRKRRV